MSAPLLNEWIDGLELSVAREGAVQDRGRIPFDDVKAILKLLAAQPIPDGDDKDQKRRFEPAAPSFYH